jgi:hypothetical protein
MTRRIRRIIDGASVVLALSALALASCPLREDDHLVSARPPSLVATRSTREAAAGSGAAGTGFAPQRIDSTATGIVRGNVFSSTRRAPTARFMPEGADASMVEAGASPAPGDYALPAASTPDSTGGEEAATSDPVPSLYGIMRMDGVPHALLTLRRGEPPRLFALGERHAGYRISDIQRDRVVLTTARGSRTLRLATPAPRDSSENLP